MCKNPAMPAHRVAVLALDDVVAFDLGMAPQLLGAARNADGDRLYDVLVCTPGGAPVRAAAASSAARTSGATQPSRNVRSS